MSFSDITLWFYITLGVVIVACMAISGGFALAEAKERGEFRKVFGNGLATIIILAIGLFLMFGFPMLTGNAPVCTDDVEYQAVCVMEEEP